MIKYISFIIVSLFLMTACGTEPKKEMSVDDLRSAKKIDNAHEVRSQVAEIVPSDTVNVPKMTFEDEVYDFGQVKQGDVVLHRFKFTNTGKKPLLINNARSTCGCTVPLWPKEAIAEGEEGVITVEFNTKNRVGKQSKPVTITTNAYPNVIRVFIKGEVLAK